MEAPTKKFCYDTYAIEKAIAIVQLIRVKIAFKIVKCKLNLGMFQAK